MEEPDEDMSGFIYMGFLTGIQLYWRFRSRGFLIRFLRYTSLALRLASARSLT